jgi:hypothetical protein
MVVQYLGHDAAVLDILESVLGKEVIERTMPADKDFEAEAKRLAKKMEEKERKQYDN